LNSLEEKITAHFGTIYLISFTKSSLRSPAMRVKFSQTYKKNNGFIWGRLFSSSSLTKIQNSKSKRLSEFISESPMRQGAILI